MRNTPVLIFCEKFLDFSTIKGKLMMYGYASESIIHIPTVNENSSFKELKPAFVLFRLFDDLRKNTHHLKSIIRDFPQAPVINLADYYTEEAALRLLKRFGTDYLNIDSLTIHQLNRSIHLSAKRIRNNNDIRKLKSEVDKQFSHNPQPMWMIDIATGKFIRVNNAAVKKYGYTSQEFLQLSIWDIRPKDDVAKLQRSLNKTKSYIHQGIWRHLTKDKKVLFVEIISHKTTYRGKDVIAAMAIDVTEKQLAIEQQKEKQTYLDAIFNNTQNAILIYDDKGRYIDANAAACKMLKYRRQELLSLYLEDVFDPSTAKKWASSAPATGRARKNSGIVKMKNKDGHTIYGFYKGVRNILPETHLAVVSDVTEEVINQRNSEFLSGIYRAAAMNRDFSAILKFVLKKICKYSGWDYSELWICDETNKELSLIASYGTEKGKGKAAFTSTPKMFAEFALKARGPISTSESPFDDHAYKNGLGHGLAIPVCKKNALQPLAVLTLFRNDPGETDPQLIKMLSTICDLLAYEIEKLKLQHDYFRLFNCSSNPIWIIDFDATIIESNPASHKLFDYPHNFLKSKKWLNFIYPPDIAKVNKAIDELKYNSQVHNLQFRIIGKKNAIKWISWTAFTDSTSCRIFIIGTDISEIKENEQVIERSANKITSMMESMSQGFFSIDKDWNVTYWNRSAEHIFNIPRAKILNKNIRNDFNNAERKNFYLECFEVIKTGNPKKFQYFYTSKNLWLGILVYPTPEGLAVYFSDITKEVLQKQEIDRIKANQAALINTTNDAVWSVDRELKIISFNKYFVEFIKVYTSKEIREGSSVIMDEFSAETTKKWKTYYKKALGGASFQVLEDVKLNDGSQRAGLVSLAPIRNKDGLIEGVACFSKDITDFQVAQEKLALSEKRFRALVQDGADMVAILDKNAVCTYVSPTTSKILGISVDEMVGKSAYHFIHSDDRKLFRQQFQSLQHQKTISLPPYRINISNDCWRWIETTLTDLSDDPAINGVVANSRDVTPRVLGEQEREQLIEDLKRYNQELLQFSYITSHNLRAPLSNLIAISNMINRNFITDANTAKLLDGFKISTNQLNDTVNDLIDTLRIKERKNIVLEQLDLKLQWDMCLHTFEESISTRKPVFQADFSKSPQVCFNRAYLNSLFTNLLSNSLKYHSPERPLVISVHSEAEGDQTVIVYSDNGVGIDISRYGKKIFGFHQRFNRHIEGKGFGLFLVRSQITACGGTIDVESEPGKGTKFTIRLKNNVLNYVEKSVIN